MEDAMNQAMKEEIERLFGGEKKSKVSTYICIGCGYIEMDADDYKELFK